MASKQYNVVINRKGREWRYNRLFTEDDICYLHYLKILLSRRNIKFQFALIIQKVAYSWVAIYPLEGDMILNEYGGIRINARISFQQHATNLHTSSSLMTRYIFL